MTTTLKWAATALIGVGGALVGVMVGWDLGPATLDLGRTELATLGGAVGFLLALTGCYLASEYAQASAQNRRHLAILGRLASSVPVKPTQVSNRKG